MSLFTKIKEGLFAVEDLEQKKILSFLDRFSSPGSKVIDVGCGYGRNLSALLKAGHKAIGVEANMRIVEENRKRGLPCLSPVELESTEKFDAILLSHVIEHFSPNDLAAFLEKYLAFLKPGGLLIIATPLMTSYFFDDFDHVRPYHPESILLLLGNQGASQMQYQSKLSLSLLDLWFRRSPKTLLFFRGRYFPGPGRVSFTLANLALIAVFRLSFGLISTKSGWTGAFRKEISR